MSRRMASVVSVPHAVLLTGPRQDPAVAVTLKRMHQGQTMTQINAQFADVIRAGAAAFEAGTRLDTCPYPEGSDEQTFWIEGYKRAQREEGE